MNKIYSKVWNKELGQLVVASEFARSDSTGVVQGAGAATLLRRSLLAAVIAPMLAMAGLGSTALAQDASWTPTDGDTITFESGDNINVDLTGPDNDATLAITLDPDLLVDTVTASTVTTGSTVMDGSGVAVGANVMLGTAGLTITGGPSVTLAGIDAGNKVITSVASGTANEHAVNFGQLDQVSGAVGTAQAAADTAQTTAAGAQAAADQNAGLIGDNTSAIDTNRADIATNRADIATNAASISANTAEIDAVRTTASAGWNISAEGGTAANVASGGTVDLSGDGNIEVSRTGTNLVFSLADDIEVGSITAGSAALGSSGLTIDGGPSVTSAGIDAGGLAITNLAPGQVAEGSTEAITGGQVYNYFIEEGASGVRYFRARSAQPDSNALGAESIAIGPNTVAEGDSSFAAGDGAATTEAAEGAIALGQGATAGTGDAVDGDGSGSIAIGRDSQAAGNSTVALGDGASVDSEYVENATAVGAGASVSGNFGTGGTAVGASAHASAENATALGTDAQASGDGSIAIGQANAAAGNAIAAGTGAYVGTGNSIALGTDAGVGTDGIPGGDRTDHIAIGTAAGQNVEGNQSTAIGYGAGQGVIGDGNVALGVEAGRGLVGNNNISIGVNANDGAGARAQAVAIGDATEAGSDSVALGSGARALGSETLALGKDSVAGVNGVALGAHTEAEGSNIALGRNSAARESDLIGTGYLTGEAVPGSAVSVGNSNPGEAFQRRITNVSDGAQRYDAVNVGQLQGAQRSVATLVGGGVTLNADGTYSPIVVDLAAGGTASFATIVEAIGAVTSGEVDILPVDAVRYNTDGGISNVAAGILGTDAVNVEQLNEAVAENGVKYFSANTTVDANRGNEGATAADAMAIGPAAVASGTSSLAIGHAARVNAGADNGVAIGRDVSARAENATVLGNRSHSYGAGGVAIGQEAVSRGQNSIVMGTGAEADPKSGQTVDNAIVIGTVAEATADDGIAIGQSALASEDRAVAQGYDAHAMATDSQAFGTRARTTGVNSQASGTDAHASGTNAIATGTNSRGYATDGIAMGTGAISGFVVNVPGDDARNHGSIAIGDTSRADDLNAMALGVEAQARAESATAIGDSAVATEDAEDGLAVGSSARVTAQNASAFGRGAEAVAQDALAVGSGARASGQNASAVGRGAEASAENASAFGQGARAMHRNSVALGSGAETAAAVGTASYTVDKNTYDFAGIAPVATVSVGVPGQERTITNVAAGRISAQSTDAINGSQLYGTNQAVDALADDLDTAGQSVAAALGGTSSYNPETHTVTAGLAVRGNNYTNVQDALTYVGQGWNVSAEGGASANVAPGGSVDFSNTDENIVIARDGTDLTFDLADDLEIGNSITFVDGDTVIDGDSIVTNNLTVGGDTQLGDNFTVNEGGVYYDGDITEGNHIVNKTYVDGEIDTLADTPLTFAGDAGTDVERRLGQTVNLVGGADESTLTDGNIGVVANGDDTLEIKLNKDIDLGEDGSLAIGDAELNNDGLAVNDGAGNSTAVGAGSIEVTGDGYTTTIGGTAVSIGGDNPILISGDTGTIGGLTNQTVDYPEFADGTGRAATEEQLDLVNQTATAGWNLSGSGAGEVNIGPNGSVDFQGDQNISVAQTGADQDGVIELTLNRDLDVDSVTAGDTVVDDTGVAVGDDVHLGDTGLVIGDADGPRFTNDGISAGGQVITNVAPGVDGTDAVNVDQLTGLANTPLTFAGDAGTDVDRLLGETVNLVGGATDEAALTDGNIGVVANGDDTLEIKLNKDIDLGEDGSLAIGDAELDNDGLAVNDGAGNSTAVGAGSIEVTGDGYTTTIGGTAVSIGGDNPILISGDTGTIGGLTNLTFDPDNIVSGQAATEDQLGNVYEVANAGWDVSAQGANATNVGVNSPTGNTVDLNNADGNIVVTKADDSNDVTFDLSDELEIGTSITVGDTFIDGDSITTTNLTVDGVTQLGDHFTVNDNGVYYEGPITEGDHIVNKTYVDGAVDDLANTPLTFAGDAGTDVERRLGETVNLVGGAADEAALTEGNIGVVADGTDTLEIKLNKDIDLGADGSVAIGNTGLDTDGLTVTGGGASTSIGAGVVTVAGATNTIVIDGNAGTIGGLTNTTFDPDSYTSGQAATEDQLKQVSDVANAGWNVSVEGEGAVADNNVGPGGTVDFSNTDGNIEIGRDGTDLVFDLADDITVDSVTAGDTFIDTTGVAIGTDVHLGNTGLVINGGPSVTVTGINAGNMVITNVAPGEISATSTDAINGSQLHGMGDSIVNVIGGNAELNPDGTITTSDIGGTGHDNIDDAIRAANDAANAGWTATDADGNAANIGPNGSVAFTGDGNISVAQTGEDNNGQVEITLNRDLDVDSITAGNTVIDTDGVQVGDNVHLGDTGLVIEGGPSVTTDGIDAGGSTLTNVAAGVNDTDAVNVGQLNQVAGDVNDLGDRMDVVEGDVADLQAGATGPFQVSQEAPLVPPTPTGANSAAGGSGADASGDNATALGNQAVASGENSTAVGQGAQATHDNSVALGQGSATTVGAQSGYDAAYVGSSDSAGEVNVGNRTITGVAPGVAGNDAVNVNQLNAGVNHAVVTANDYTDQRINQVQGDVWNLHGRVDDLEKSINSGVATAMAMRQAPYVAGATTYFAGFGAYKDQGALGVSMRRTADNGRWSLEGGFSANRDGAGGYIGVSGVIGSK
ncbi:ESPR-type extended signal peptide-containing protein [Luteimonas sp. MJ293]|uniref:ESPR-type extended signal peptide-containing protein n=1 Tax=Luteimonas sp. MJ146 TaxID=3129240 RepID=UPI0031B9E785